MNSWLNDLTFGLCGNWQTQIVSSAPRRKRLKTSNILLDGPCTDAAWHSPSPIPVRLSIARGKRTSSAPVDPPRSLRPTRPSAPPLSSKRAFHRGCSGRRSSGAVPWGPPRRTSSGVEVIGQTTNPGRALALEARDRFDFLEKLF